MKIPALLSAIMIVFFAAGVPAAEPVRLVCIGDSITQGNNGTADRQRTYSWRYPLWKRFVAAGQAVEMVGAMTDGFEGAPPYAPYQGVEFPNRHEGRWGWTAMGVRDEVRKNGPTWTADIAIILLGTNGNSEGKPIAETVTAISDLVGLLRARNAHVRVVIGQPFQPWKPFPELAGAYAALATTLNTATAPVIAVPTGDGWISDPKQPDTCTIDWVHPNVTGDDRLAERFFTALKPWLQTVSH